MDAVKSFNAELSSLYEVKPPISKAKMTALTRGAIKAIKFYKHVVQSVEKFILKCKPEYKVPGLYVIDSIVRQSRHQFGSDKDVFAPRFAKNMQQTFANLFRCPPEDKSKVIRVLNLWQKNQVFPPEVIQPLFDFVDPNHPIHKEAIAAQQAANNAANGVSNQSGMLNSLNKGSPSGKTPTKTPNHQDISTPHLQGTPNSTNIGGVDVSMLQQLQKLQRLFLHQTSGTPQDSNSAQLTPSGQPVRFDKKLLDFDYGSEDEDDKNPSPAVNPTNQQNTNLNSGLESLKNILANPEVLRQLQTLQQLQTSNSGGVQTQPLTAQALAQQQLSTQMDLEEKMRKLREMKQQEDEFDRHLAQTVPNLPFASECDLNPTAPTTNSSSSKMGQYPGYPLPFDMTQPPPGYGHNNNNIPSTKSSKSKKSKQNPLYSPILDTQSENDLFDERTNVNGEVINLDQTDSQSPQSPQDLEERYERSHRKVRSRSRDRSKRSRSREKRTNRRGSRSRSHSRSRKRNRRSRSREREKERDREKDREKDRERRKRGLPPLKTDNLSVCSTTLWVGHLSKLVHADELSDTFGEFGDIVSIDLIPPRGCAFIVMNRRQDAARCLSKLRNHKMQGKAITLAWAPGKGVKGKDWKDYWEVDLGVSYIPWNKLNEGTDLELLEEGGMIDEESMPKWMKNRLEEQRSLQVAKSQPPVQLPEIPIPPTDITQRAPPGYHPEGMPLQAQPGLPNTASMPPNRVDTSQPPPQAMIPPMTLPLVPPFQMMRGAGMPLQLPPGMLGPNVPIGVPPPNLQQSLMQNQMMGYGHQRVLPSPHMSQMPPMSGNVPPPNVPDKDSLLGSGPPPGFVGQRIPTIITSQPPPNINKMGFPPNHPPPIVQHQQDDMDIDMDDMDSSQIQNPRSEKSNNITLSDQLLAVIEGSSKSGRGTSQPKDNIDERSRSREFDNRRGRGDSAGSRNSNSRDRDRRDSRNMRDNRDLRRRDNSRDHRDRNDQRERRGDRRDRERWPEREMQDQRSRDRDSDRADNKRQKTEKSLTERLQEMANENFSGRRPDENRMPPGGLIPEEKCEFPYQRSPKEHEDNRDPRNHEFGPRGGPMIPPNMRGAHPFMPPQEEMGGERFDRFGPQGFDRRDGPPPGFDRRGNNEGFDNRMRGPQGMPPEFFGPPGFNRGPPMQMMRAEGPPIHGFGPRGPMMGNQRGGPPMFQRGGARGSRGGHQGGWMDGPPRGPAQNFGPNRGFDGPMDGPPPQFFQGPQANMRPPFEDETAHMQGFGPNRGRPGPPMGDGRRYQRSHDSDEMIDERDYRNNRDRVDKRSRWGQNSEDGYSRHERSDNSGDESRSDRDKLNKAEEGGNTTPLHDEPFVNETRNDSYTEGNEEALSPEVNERKPSISSAPFKQFDKTEELFEELSEPKTELNEPKEEPAKEEYNEPSQEKYTEPSQEDYTEPPQGEYNEPSQEDFNEPPQEEYNEPSQEKYNEPSQEEFNELPKEEYNEPQEEFYEHVKETEKYNPEEYTEPIQEEFNEPEMQEAPLVKNELEAEQCNLPEVSAVEDNEVSEGNEVAEG